MNNIKLIITTVALIGLSACSTPQLGGNVKKEYFTNGQIMSEFIMSDSTGQNGLLKKYGFDGKLTSTVPIKNGVKNGIEILYDDKGRVLRKTPYVNGKKHGTITVYYPNGDILATIPYVNGVREGYAYKYRPDGTVLQKVLFKEGRIAN
jgi:antitoxin component YwqK of YwqJK toxin-antitoxin module